MENGLTGDEGYARVGPGEKETLATRRPVRILLQTAQVRDDQFKRHY